jgi:DNA replication protein DnaC
VANGYCQDCADQQKQRERRSGRVEKQRRLRALQMRHIPTLYQSARLSHLPAKLAKIIQDGHNVLMWGAVGCGKTYAAFAAIRQNLTKRVNYVNWENFLIHLRNFENKSEDSKMETLTKPDVLVIDDIGTSVSEYSTRMLFVVIDSRLNHGRRTIITTNHAPAELQNLYGERIGSRLATYRIVHLQGKDQRRKG